MPVLPIRTERLHLRVMKPADAPALAAYRTLPEVALFQDWPVPYSVADAEAMLTEQADADDLVLEKWIQIAIDVEGEMVGDLAVGYVRGGSTAFLGYTLAPEHQGKGYASEAAAAMVDAIFAGTEVHRIVATLDPENFASMRVIEPLGFEYEGIARKSELVRGEWVDDMRFALLREDRAVWLARDRSPVGGVELREIGEDERRDVLALRTHRFQRQFVADMPATFCDALFPESVNGTPAVPWYRAIHAGGALTGFLMVAEPTRVMLEPYLWRLLIDRRHQGRGIGKAAMRLLIDRLRTQGHTTLMTSWTEAPGGPEPFYLGFGFVRTGEIIDDEIEGRLQL